MILDYKDTCTMVKVSSTGYGNKKVVVEQAVVPCIFIQNTSFVRIGFQENTDADAFCYPDPSSSFVIDNSYRLEGMYILEPLFDIDSEEGWYKVESTSVNRDHLLSNQIDNVQLTLKKTRRIDNVS